MSEGILLVNKERGCTSFSLVSLLRRMTSLSKIGHAGTLDPFAQGLMVMLIGRTATTQSDRWLHCDKEYQATLRLGTATDSYDLDGMTTHSSLVVPSMDGVHAAMALFQGGYAQMPPMFSAKKVAGKKLYQLARRGITIDRERRLVSLTIQLLSYQYPYLELHITCSKGTYIRSLAHDLGEKLGTFAHLSQLIRLRSGPFSLKESLPQGALVPGVDLGPYLLPIS